jgi:hypothetical protein
MISKAFLIICLCSALVYALLGTSTMINIYSYERMCWYEPNRMIVILEIFIGFLGLFGVAYLISKILNNEPL